MHCFAFGDPTQAFDLEFGEIVWGRVGPTVSALGKSAMQHGSRGCGINDIHHHGVLQTGGIGACKGQDRLMAEATRWDGKASLMPWRMASSRNSITSGRSRRKIGSSSDQHKGGAPRLTGADNRIDLAVVALVVLFLPSGG